MEGIKDVLFYKFRRPTIGQNCSAVCTNNGPSRGVVYEVILIGSKFVLLHLHAHSVLYVQLGR